MIFMQDIPTNLFDKLQNIFNTNHILIICTEDERVRRAIMPRA